jgi:hypothetical protein
MTSWSAGINIGVTVHVIGFWVGLALSDAGILLRASKYWKGNADETHFEIDDRLAAWCRGYFADPRRKPGQRLPLYIAGQGQGLQVLNCC